MVALALGQGKGERKLSLPIPTDKAGLADLGRRISIPI
jgi:hypothetical protein